MKIMSMPRMPTSGPEAFPSGALCGRVHGFDSSNEDLFEPIPIGRGSGTGSPTSLEPPSAPGGVESGAPAPSYGSDGASLCSGSGGVGSAAGGGDMDPTRSFPLVLHAIVSESESDCVHWLPCGTRFVIADKDTFSRNVLPRYFGGRGGATTKFTSFTRRLKRWNFSRVPSGREMGAYYHDKFRRGEPALAKSITYPASRSPGSGAGRGSGARRPSVPKARRRASTGSMPPGDWKAMAALKSSEPAVSLDSMSPTPIKASMNPVDFPSPPPENPMADSDLKSWLTSADFIEVGGSAMSNLNDITPSVNAESGSLASSSFFPPPPLLSQGIMLRAGAASMPVRPVGTGAEPQAEGGGGHHTVFDKANIGAMNPISTRPAAPMRRHSMTMPAPNVTSLYMPMMASSGSSANPFDSSQLTSNPNFAMLAANNMRFAPNNHAALTTNIRPNDPPRPEQTGSFKPEITGSKGEQFSGLQLENSGSNCDDSLKDPFSMSYELGFGDLKEIDPFT